MKRGFRSEAPAGRSSALEAALRRLDELVNLERADRSAGAPGAAALQRADLAPIHDLLAHLGAPEQAFPAVHVTGTKGKGTVAALVAAALERAGYRVGLYTSPHVEHVRERVVVEGEPLADELLAAHLVRALDARDAAVAAGSAGRNSTWFDVLTAAALSAFAALKVEIAVVEVGLGGRLDSTNVVKSEVVVVTNIELEHTAILGSTRALIAAEKAGILRGDRAGVPLVTGVAAGDSEAAPPLRRAAQARGSRLVHVPQAGTLEERNLRLAGAVLDELARRGWKGRGGVALDSSLVRDASVRARARLPGRLELCRAGSIPVVLDGAHVPASLSAVLDDLNARPEFAGRPVVVLGVGSDKDAHGLLKVLQGRVDRVVCTTRGTGPALAAGELLRIAEELGIPAEQSPDPRDALEEALLRAAPEGWVLVTGSLHLVGAVRGRVCARSEDPAC